MAERHYTRICSWLPFKYTHTQPNWRVPPIPECHVDAVCTSSKCKAALGNARDIKISSKLAQRVQRQCTGYYCGYTFKPRPIGRKYLAGAAESLSYLNTGMKDKSVGQQWHRITHRMLVDFQHRCVRRTAPEEWNLCASYQEHDPTTAEYIRTYMSVDFNGGQLLARLEFENSPQKVRSSWKYLPSVGSILRQLDDLYGVRGNHPWVFLLSPWEWHMHWEAVPLPADGHLGSFGKNPNPSK